MERENKIKILVGFLCLSALLGGVFVLSPAVEDFLYWKLGSPDAYLANLRRGGRLFVENYGPIRDWQVEEPTFQAQSVLAVEVNQGQWRPLLAKNDQYPFVIASLTKLMTAMVAIDDYSLDRLVRISEEAVNQPEDTSFLKAGDYWRVEDLLRMALMESSNDAAYALAEIKGVGEFVQEMNKKAAEEGLTQTRFVNPTGLVTEEGTNLSSSRDLANLTYDFLTNPAYEIMVEIVSCPEFSLLTPGGQFHHLMVNSHQLLGEFSYLIGGKTGYLPDYGGSLLSIFQQPEKETYLLTVILDSPDRFGETEKLAAWLSHSYLHLFNYYGYAYSPDSK